MKSASKSFNMNKQATLEKYIFHEHDEPDITMKVIMAIGMISALGIILETST